MFLLSYMSTRAASSPGRGATWIVLGSMLWRRPWDDSDKWHNIGQRGLGDTLNTLNPQIVSGLYLPMLIWKRTTHSPVSDKTFDLSWWLYLFYSSVSRQAHEDLHAMLLTEKIAVISTNSFVNDPDNIITDLKVRKAGGIKSGYNVTADARALWKLTLNFVWLPLMTEATL